MRFYNWCGVVVAALLACASPAFAQGPPADQQHSNNLLNGGGAPDIRSSGSASFTAPLVYSGYSVRDEAWVNGVSVSSCASGSIYGNACAKTQPATLALWPGINVNATAVHNGFHYNCWTTSSKAFWIYNGAYHEITPTTRSSTQCWAEPPHHNPVQCPVDGPYWCGGSPILIPTGGPMALKLTAPAVHFDIDGDGVADFVGWVEDGDDFAFLAYDRNGNGIIDDGTELLGNHFDPSAPNGFLALSKLIQNAGETFPVGEINASNAAFSRLLLWNDRNRNGVSDPGELRPASNVVSAIGLGFYTTGRTDPDGNQYAFKGWARFAANGAEKPIYDVNLATQ